MFLLVRRLPDGDVELTTWSRPGPEHPPAVVATEVVRDADLVEAVRRRESGPEGASGPRWVWDDTPRWYPRLLDAGVTLARCVDLRLVHAILRRSTAAPAFPPGGAAPGPWDVAQAVPGESDGQCDRGTGTGLDPARGNTADPAAGAWFRSQAVELVRLANPPVR